MDIHKNSPPSDRTVDVQEIEKFSAMADTWWDPDGPMRPLHLLNPCRLAFIRSQIVEHFGLENTDRETRVFQGLSILDIGCGGGLVSEPLCRLGAKVTGIDATEKNIQIAKAHAEWSGLDIDYHATTTDALIAEQHTYHVVLALEVVEHVADVDAFVQGCSQLIKPNGMVILSTLNRNIMSFLTAIVGAEYILRWLPKGTHDWKRFLRPSELVEKMIKCDLNVKLCKGLHYNPLTKQWSIVDDPLVNYFLVAKKAHS